MIDPNFYKKENAKRVFYGGIRPHYDLREPVIVTESTSRVLEYGEDFISLSEAFFGKGKQSLWPYLCDANYTRHVDDWQMGDKINVPKTVVVPKLSSERDFSV